MTDGSPTAVQGVGPGSIRVVRILTRFNVGGPARQALALQGEMADLGFSTLLVGGVVQAGEADLARLHGVTDVIRIPHLGRRVSPAHDLRATLTLYRLIARIRPDVVHTHMAKAGALGRAAAVAAGVPVRVHTFHGHVLNGYFGRTATRSVVWAERVLARASSALVAVSDQVRRDLLARGVGSPDRFHVIHAGLDLEPYLSLDRTRSAIRTTLGIGRHERVIGMAGRLVPVKGLDVLVAAVQGILASRPDVRLLVAGEGPEMGFLRSAVGRMPGGRRVHFLGWVSDMAEFYRAIDVMVLSSRSEGTPLSLIEASAAGIPVVATRVGGVPEVVRDGMTGILVPPDSAAELRAGVERILDEPILAKRLGAAGRQIAPLFTARRLAQALAELYRSLIREARRSTPRLVAKDTLRDKSRLLAKALGQDHHPR